MSIQKRSSQGYSASANYTFSKCEGHPTQGGGTPNVASGYMVPVSILNQPADADARLDRDFGPCDTDRRHIFNLTATAESPDFENDAAHVILSDWRLSGVFRASSGDVLNITSGLDRALTGNTGVQRPDVVQGVNAYVQQGTTWLNPGAFAQPAQGTYGNVGRNAYRGPGFRTVDLSLVRAFRFANTHEIQARFEAFNAFNWVNYNAPTTVLNNANFGKILGAGDPRIMQFAVKYSF